MPRWGLARKPVGKLKNRARTTHWSWGRDTPAPYAFFRRFWSASGLDPALARAAARVRASRPGQNSRGVRRCISGEHYACRTRCRRLRACVTGNARRSRIAERRRSTESHRHRHAGARVPALTTHRCCIATARLAVQPAGIDFLVQWSRQGVGSAPALLRKNRAPCQRGLPDNRASAVVLTAASPQSHRKRRLCYPGRRAIAECGNTPPARMVFVEMTPPVRSSPSPEFVRLRPSLVVNAASARSSVQP